MKFALAFVAALSIAAVATPSSAQVIPASQVLSDCPDVPQGQACPALATAFLGNETPTPSRDQQIVDLVVAIAEAAQQNNVSRQACLNAADGLRILATGVSTAEQSTQISDIADALCARARTASIGRSQSENTGFTFSVPESLSEQSSSGAGGAGGAGGAITVASNDDEEDGETGTETTVPVVTDDPGNSGCAGQSCQSNASPTGLNPPGLEDKDKKPKKD